MRSTIRSSRVVLPPIVRKVLRDEQANSMVELSLIVSLLLLLLLGTLDYGRFRYYDSAFGNAAEVGPQTAMHPCSYRSSCDAQALPQPDLVVM